MNEQEFNPRPEDMEITLTVRALRQLKAEAAADAIRVAASNPALRLRGHSGVSVRSLRSLANEIEEGA